MKDWIANSNLQLIDFHKWFANQTKFGFFIVLAL
jgi:hypothetical protein